MFRSKLLILPLASMVALLWGCTVTTETKLEMTSGEIGCAPEDLVISDEEDRTWAATCADKTFRCTATFAGYAGLEAKCTETITR